LRNLAFKSAGVKPPETLELPKSHILAHSYLTEPRDETLSKANRPASINVKSSPAKFDDDDRSPASVLAGKLVNILDIKAPPIELSKRSRGGSSLTLTKSSIPTLLTKSPPTTHYTAKNYKEKDSAEMKVE